MSDAAEQEFADVIGRLTALKPIEPSPALGERVARLEEASEVGARISLRCTYCHDALERAAAAFCAACLAPHHRGCFAAHGTCSAPGCEETTALYPGQGAAIARPVRGAALALAASC